MESLRMYGLISGLGRGLKDGVQLQMGYMIYAGPQHQEPR